MQRRTEFEQLKTEYRNVQVPEEGLSVVMKAMADAKKDRKRRVSQLTRYGTLAASLVLVFFLGWRALALKGGASMENSMVQNMSFDTKVDSYDMVPEAAAADTTATNKENSLLEGWYELKAGMSTSGNSVDTEKYDSQENGSSVVPESMTAPKTEKVKEYLTTEEARVKAAKEVLRMAKEYGLEEIEAVLGKTEDGTAVLLEDQSCYLNEKGALVLVFDIIDTASKQTSDRKITISLSKEMLEDLK